MALSNRRSTLLLMAFAFLLLALAVSCRPAAAAQPAAGVSEAAGGGPSRLELYSALMTRLSDQEFAESDHFRTMRSFCHYYRKPDKDDPEHTGLLEEFKQALEQMPKCVGLLTAALNNPGCFKHKLSTEEKTAFARELSAFFDARHGIIRETVRMLSSYSLYLDSQRKKKQGILCLMFCFSLLGDIESLLDFLPKPDKTELGTDPYFAHSMVMSTLEHCYDVLAGKITANAYGAKILKRLSTIPASVTRRLAPWDSVIQGVYQYNSGIIRLMGSLDPMPGGMGFPFRDTETETVFLHEVKKRPCAVELVKMYTEQAIEEWTDIIRRVREAFAHPYRKRQELLKEVHDDILAYKYHNLINHLIVPGFHYSNKRAVFCLAVGRFAETACLLELYLEQNGAYPDNLDSITQGTVPDDPFTGKPFIYYRFNGEYALVCGGPDSTVTLTEKQVLQSLADRYLDQEIDDSIFSNKQGLLKNYLR